MDKSSVLNQPLFYFQTKAIKLALQLSLDFFFFGVINNFLSNDHTWFGMVCDQKNQEIS
jgi:hypothetical protein